MDFETRFKQLAQELAPTSKQQARVRRILENRIAGPAILSEAKKDIHHIVAQKHAVWREVNQKIASPGIASVFDHLRSILHPSGSTESSLKYSILERLIPSQVSFAERFTKWGAAFVIVLLGLRASPFLFLAPQSIADSSVIVIPSAAGVELSSHDLWQPITRELELHDAAALRTGDGEATIMLHDDGNVRLDSHTTIALQDVSDQLTSVSTAPTLTLHSGTVWIQALLPDQLRGFVVLTPAGSVTIHGGSASVRVAGDLVHVEVWDRHASVSHDGKTLSLVSGEYVDLVKGQKMSLQRLPADAYKEPWIAQNLERDSVHQREMAQLQQERRSAEAGILPNSPFYTVKRVAENVDVLLTLDPTARVQKRLQQAGTRLNEAAALILQGDSGSSIPLDEYKQALIDVAAGSGDTMTQYLVQQQVAENAAQLSATLPNDQLYVLKKTVLEASAQLPDDVVDQSDVNGTVLVDTLDVLQQAIQNKDRAQIQRSLIALAPYLPSLQSGTGEMLKEEDRKEALTLLSQVASGLQEAGEQNADPTSDDVVKQIADYLPAADTEEAITKPVITLAPHVPMTEAQINAAVDRTLRRVMDIYTMSQSRLNALRVEMKKFEGHPDEGRYLRRLYDQLPEDETKLKQLVRHGIQQLREEQFVIGLDQSTGTGGTK